MASIRLHDVIGNTEAVESYTLFRTIEDWCYDNIPDGSWQFDHSHSISAYGVDVAGGIIFKYDKDAVAFKLKFPLD
jgi:hypothetical protein